MTQPNVLVTGMSGLIGGIARQHLQDNYTLSALNRSSVEGVPCVQADISDLDAILPAFADIHTVVHLSAIAHGAMDWDELLHTNIIGTYNVFEAARRAGVKRVVFASSGSVTAGWEHEEPYKALVEGRYEDAGDSWPKLNHETPTRPKGIYGATKVWGEALARHFVDTTDMSILCLRIGHVTDDDQAHGLRGASVWCSHRDVGNMIARCVAAPDDLKYDIFYVVSNNQWNYRDLEHAQDVLGFEPQD